MDHAEFCRHVCTYVHVHTYDVADAAYLHNCITKLELMCDIDA